MFGPRGHLLGQLEVNYKGHTNAITLKNEKQLDESKATQGEEGEGLVKDKGKESMEKEVDLVSEYGQDEHEEVTKHRMFESYRPPVPCP